MTLQWIAIRCNMHYADIKVRSLLQWQVCLPLIILEERYDPHCVFCPVPVDFL